ncbi:hypothetical protein AAFF_G00204690 [Aldrovandia affinis]|uniref:Sodium channel regulatory subunit beta-3 n=1 Tax=Aldrovandia affinis TaxID=143900 RepID=A0AAD7W5T4_9TELE|nr:hypothetical protein AAFF_G00204690 [Aldrovandia affinis]
MTYRMALLSCFLLSILYVPQSEAGCAEVVSMTEAVEGETFLLGCISCKKREEVPSKSTVDWYFRAPAEEDFSLIFHHEHPFSTIHNDDFEDRLEWHGTNSADLQIASILIHNVTFNDTGTYRCTIQRVLELVHKREPEEHVTINLDVELTVVAVANRELTSVISEVMMYVLIVVLQLWLIGVLIYCYKKISAEREAYEARRALHQPNPPPDSKDNCDGVHLE